MRLRFTIREFLWLAVIAVLAVVLIAIWGIHRTTENVLDSYAVYWVAEMVIFHLDANNDQWPRNWDDLRDDYLTCATIVGEIPWSLEELGRRVRVDWSANVAALKESASQSGKPQFRVIWLADGSDVHWQGDEPNQMIGDFFAGRRKPLSKPR